MDPQDRAITLALWQVLSLRTTISTKEEGPGPVAILIHYIRRYYVSQIQGSGYLAEDFTQDVYMKALGKREQLDDPEKVKAWFDRIAYNLLIDYIRHRDVERRVAEEYLDPRPPVPVDPHGADAYRERMPSPLLSLHGWVSGAGAKSPDGAVTLATVETWVAHRAPHLLPMLAAMAKAWEIRPTLRHERELVMRELNWTRRDYNRARKELETCAEQLRLCLESHSYDIDDDD